MKKSILSLEGVFILSKPEMKNAFGGVSKSTSIEDASGDCKIYVTNASGTGGYWTGRNYTVTAAQYMYNGGNGWTFNDGSRVTGYCCASC